MTKNDLLHAQRRSACLFDMIEKVGLIRPGKTESQLVSEITELTREGFDIHDHWHKKIVRVGRNTMATFSLDPPDEVVRDNDIVFVDLGPIVEGYEADLGRTFVLGNDPMKIKIKHDVERAWYEIQEWVSTKQQLTGAELFEHAAQKAQDFGWTFTGEIAGHIVGKYPHEQPLDLGSFELDIHPDNHYDIFRKDDNGNERYWILELQFIDKEHSIGAYFEQLLCTEPAEKARYH